VNSPRIEPSGIFRSHYHRASLREERHLRFAAERRIMVAQRFKAGTSTPTIDCVAERQLMLFSIWFAVGAGVLSTVAFSRNDERGENN
jgi:hypothetical protein